MMLNNTDKIRDILLLNKKKGDVGIEIECEAGVVGPHFPVPPEPWIATHDGSLRGICIEYVMSNPQKIDDAEAQIAELREKISEEGTNLKYSIRAGVHVHVNVQEMTPQQVMMFAATYYTLEELLTEWCGDDRVGNLFCLRACDAEEVLSIAGKTLATGAFQYFSTDDIRYAALNFCSLPKYGSLEFRALATEPDFTRISKWARMLVNIREKSKEYESIQSLLEQFSQSTPQEWVISVLGDNASEVINQDFLEEKVWDGVHTAQDLMFHTLRNLQG